MFFEFRIGGEDNGFTTTPLTPGALQNEKHE